MLTRWIETKVLPLLGLLAVAVCFSFVQQAKADLFSDVLGTGALYVGDDSNYNIRADGPSASAEICSTGTGDVNDDGKKDMIYGACQGDTNGTNSGSVYVIFGDSNISNLSPTTGDRQFRTSDADLVYTGPYAGARLGTSVAGNGDFNNDGANDILIGGTGLHGGCTPVACTGYITGGGYIIWGGSSIAGNDLSNGIAMSNGMHIFGNDNDGGHAGSDVSFVGDMNGDGAEEAVIADPNYDNPNESLTCNGSNLKVDCGSAWVIYGMPNQPRDIMLQTDGDGCQGDNPAELKCDQSGYGSASEIGELGALYETSTADDVNSVVDSDKIGPVDTLQDGNDGFRIDGGDEGAHLFSVQGGGDFNGDDIPDVVVGEPYINANTSGNTNDEKHNGAAAVIYGKNSSTAVDLSNLSSSKGLLIKGPDKGGTKVIASGHENGAWAGYSVAFVPDVDNDGDDEVLVGAPYAIGTDNNSAKAAGRIYLIKGKQYTSATMDLNSNNGSNVFTVIGNAGTNFGMSVDAAGDLNDDNYQDFIVGSPANGGLVSTLTSGSVSPGSAYIVYGSGTNNWGHTYNVNEDFNGYMVRIDGANGCAISLGNVSSGGCPTSLTNLAESDELGGSGDSLFESNGYTSLYGQRMVLGLGGNVRWMLSPSNAKADYDYDNTSDVVVAAHNADNNYDNSGSAYMILGSNSVIADGGSLASDGAGGTTEPTTSTTPTTTPTTSATGSTDAANGDTDTGGGDSSTTIVYGDFTVEFKKGSGKLSSSGYVSIYAKCSGFGCDSIKVRAKLAKAKGKYKKYKTPMITKTSLPEGEWKLIKVKFGKKYRKGIKKLQKRGKRVYLAFDISAVQTLPVGASQSALTVEKTSTSYKLKGTKKKKKRKK